MVPRRKEERYNDSGTAFRGESMVHDAANAFHPSPSPVISVSRARFVTAKPARVSLASARGKGLKRGRVAAPRGRGKRQSLITHYLDMHVG